MKHIIIIMKIFTLMAEGKRVCQISEIMGINSRTIYRYIREYEETFGVGLYAGRSKLTNKGLLVVRMWQSFQKFSESLGQLNDDDVQKRMTVFMWVGDLLDRSIKGEVNL